MRRRPPMRRPVSLAVLTAALLLCAVHAKPSVQSIVVRPPRAAKPGSWRGFPPVVSVHRFAEPASLLARVRQAVGLERPVMEIAEKFHVVDLLGGISSVGEYYTQIFIGGQPVRVQIDTGSSTLALPMAECTHCLSSDLRYNMKLSRHGRGRWVSCTNKLCRPDMCAAHHCAHCSASDACCAGRNPSACGFSLKYGDKSFARGALVVDDMTWGDNITAKVVFGGILEDSTHFERRVVDGILGMAYKALACNPTCVEPPFQQMVKAGKVEDSFAICVYGEGGKLVLGGMDPVLAAGKMTYVPLALSKVPTYYSVNVSNVLRIGERNMHLPYFRKVIVDSGTTLLVVKVTVFNMLMEHLQTHYCHIDGLCGAKSWFRPAACSALSDEMVAKLPVLKFDIGDKGGFILELRPEDYMIRYHQHGSIMKSKLRCVGIMAMKHLSHGNDAIFGNTVMTRYVTHYDRANKRIGFAVAEQGCGSPPKCHDLSTCVECASQVGCSFDFVAGTCGPESGLGLIPYPKCSGASCICALGPQAGLIFGSVAGFFSMLLICGIGLFVIVLYGRGTRGREQQHEYTLAGREDDESDDETLFVQTDMNGHSAKRIQEQNGASGS